MAVKVLAKRGTAAQIEGASSSVQSAGEIAFATDTKDFYVSDGTQFNKIGTSDLEAFDEITIGLDLDTWHVNPDNFIDITTDSSPMEVTFKPDGTRVFVLGSTTRTVLQYDLGTAWDLTTAGSVTQSSSLTTLSGGLLGGSLEGLYIDSTGTRLYALSRGSDSISQYTIDTAWDISSLTFVQDIHVNSTGGGGFVIGDNNPRAMTFKPDGTVIYIAGYDSDEIHQIPLSTAWDISTHGTITSISYDPPANVVTGIQFSSDGTTLFTIDDTGESIEQWTLSTAWDITTLTLAGVSLPIISMYETTPQGLYYSDTLAKAFVVGSSRDFVWEIVVEESVKFSKAIHSDAVYGRTVNAHQINVHIEDDNINGIRVARSNHVQYANLSYAILNFGNGSGQIRGNSLAFYQNQTLSNGDAFKFFPTSGRRLTDADAEQSFMKLTPDIGQSGTANYVGLLMDVTETSVGSGTNSLMDLRVGGTSKFMVGNDGNVGIGTTEPTELLQVGNDSTQNNYIRIAKKDNSSAGIKISEDGGREGFFRVNLSEDLEIGTEQTNDVTIFTNNVARIKINGDVGATQGYVGIGTTSPQQLLDITATTAAPVLRLSRNQNIGGTSWAGESLGDIEFYTNDGSNPNVFGKISVIGGPDSGTPYAGYPDGHMVFFTAGQQGGSLSEKMRITDEGNVGIGTASPTDKLHIQGNFGNNTFKVRPNSDHTIISSDQEFRIATTNSADIFIAPNGLKKAVFKATGYVGIGTTSPASDLSVSGRADISSRLRVGAAGNPNKTLEVWGDQIFATSGGATWATFDQSEEKVGIGTTLPTEKLEVSGNIKATRVVSNILRDTNNNGHLVTTVTNASNTATVVGNSATANTLTLGVKSAGNVVAPNGNFGIGTTAPTENLEISSSGTTTLKIGSTNSFGRSIELYTTGVAAFLDVESDFSIRKYDGNPLWVGEGGIVISNQYFYGGYINFRKRGTTTNLAQIGLETGSNTYFNTGNFGIGTTAPAHKLEVNGDISLPLGNILRWGSQLGIRKDSNGELNFFGGTNSTNGGFNFRAWNGSAYESGTLVIRNNGNVGIGTTSPAVSLDVDGQVHLGPQTATGFPSIDIASNGRTTIRGSAPALSVRDNNNNGGYIDMGGGTLANINSITSSSTLLFSSTNVRFGGDLGARVNIVGQNSSSQKVLGLKQGTSGSNIMIEIRDSSNVSTMGITSEGGFYFKDSDLVGRYTFDHDYSPSPADGLTTGFEFRTENKNGVLTTFGYIDVTNDDRTAEESSMRLSVGQSTPTEIMRLQSDGNVGIGTTSPSDYANAADSLVVASSGDTGITIATTDTTKESNIYFADGTTGDAKYRGGFNYKHSSDLMQIFVGGSAKAAFDSTGKLGIGTTSPTGILHAYSTSAAVFESASNAGVVIRRNDNVGYSALLKYHSGNTEKFVTGLSDSGDYTGSTGEEYIIGTTKTNPLVVLKNDGKLGIGQVTPTEKLDVTGNIKASGTIKGKMEQMFTCSFADDLGTDKHYLPFTSNNEQTNVHADQAAMVMPYHGRVKAIQMRLSNIDAAGDRTFGIETIAAGTNMYASSDLWTVQETEAYTLEAEDDYKLVNYVFDNSEHFRDGDLLAISIEDSADLYSASRQTYVTVIIEYDLNNGMGNDTSTTKYG